MAKTSKNDDSPFRAPKNLPSAISRKNTVFDCVWCWCAASHQPVAAACGFAIPEAEKHEILDKLTSTSAGTGESKSSLCADLRSGRPTEIDRIYGTVVRFGKEHGVPTPTLDTLIAIVRGMESHYI